MNDRPKSGPAPASLALLERRASAGDPDAQFALAKHYRDGTAGPPNRAKSVDLLLQAAGSGHYRAMWMVAAGYQFGRWGFPRDEQRALLWDNRIIQKLHRDAAAGHEYAQNELAAISSYRSSKTKR